MAFSFITPKKVCIYCEREKELSYFNQPNMCKACERRLKRINEEKKLRKKQKLERAKERRFVSVKDES